MFYPVMFCAFYFARANGTMPLPLNAEACKQLVNGSPQALNTMCKDAKLLFKLCKFLGPKVALGLKKALKACKQNGAPALQKALKAYKQNGAASSGAVAPGANKRKNKAPKPQAQPQVAPTPRGAPKPRTPKPRTSKPRAPKPAAPVVAAPVPAIHIPGIVIEDNGLQNWVVELTDIKIQQGSNRLIFTVLWYSGVETDLFATAPEVRAVSEDQMERCVTTNWKWIKKTRCEKQVYNYLKTYFPGLHQKMNQNQASGNQAGEDDKEDLSTYEKQRLANMEKIRQVFVGLGLDNPVLP